MKSVRKNKKLILIILLAGLLPLLILAARQIQELRGRAAGTSEVGVRLTPSSGTFNPGEQMTLKIAMHKLATRAINVSGAQAQILVSDKFTINSASCEAPFNSLPFTRITGQNITVMCAISSAETPVAVTAADLPFATLNLTVAGSAVAGSGPVTFTSTRVTEAGVSGQAPDVSTAGESGNYDVGGGGGTPPVTGDVVLSFSPGQVNLPPDSTVKIMADSGTKKVGFTRTVFTFDPAKINLASEITATNPNLSTPVEKTSMAVANQQGKAVIVVASSPSDIPPGGVFEMASFTIKAISTAANDTATINFLTSDMQYIDEANQILTLGAIPLSITLNGQNVTVTATPPITGGVTATPPVTGDVVLSFSPGQVNLPPDSTVKIMADSGTKKVGFTRTVFTFDPAKINLASEITATNPNLSTPVEKTSMAVANQQGKAVIVVASSPSDIPPGGVFELASFTIKAISTVANDTATINFLTSDMQYIDEANQILTLGAIPLSITLNGQNVTVTATPPPGGDFRSEERRVGKEC